MNDLASIPSVDEATKYRIWELETALQQAIQELRDASNVCTSCDMPVLGKNFALAAERKQATLEASYV